LLLAATCIGVAAADTKPADRKFLIASDLHFNPMADPKLVDALIKAAPAQWQPILNRSQPAAFSQYGEDTNWWLLQSALNAMRTTEPHPAFIVITGDLLAHHFPDTFRRITGNNDPQAYRKFVRSTIEFLALQLRQRFLQSTILPTPGNNDDDCGDYQVTAGGAYLQDTSALVRKLTRSGNELEQTWRSLGSFDVPHPALAKTRVISLSTVFFSAKYQAADFDRGCAAVPSNAAADLFAWLQTRLSHAQQAGEKVWLMFHIPPGMDGFSTIRQYLSLLKSGQPPAEICPKSLVPMWKPEWTAKFSELLEQYAGTIALSLAGHTHTDDFRVMGKQFVLINASVSPVYNQNPSFRVATLARDGSLSDDSVYYLSNLEYASKTTPGEWEREYTFSREWETRGINAGDFASIYANIAKGGADRATWLRLYNVSSSAAHIPAEMVPGLYCAIEGLNPETYGQCFCSAVASSH
jgi:hypothetical protein